MGNLLEERLQNLAYTVNLLKTNLGLKLTIESKIICNYNYVSIHSIESFLW